MLAQIETLPVYGQPDSREIEVVFISTHNDQATKSKGASVLPLDLFTHLQRQGYQSLHVITDKAVLQLKNKLVFVGTREQLEAQVDVLKKKYRDVNVKVRAFEFKTVPDWGFFTSKYTVMGDTTTITDYADARKTLEYTKTFFAGGV
jgi:hypothetical protein